MMTTAPEESNISPRDTAHHLHRITRHSSVVLFSKYLLLILSITLILLVFIIPALRSDHGGERLVFSTMPSGQATKPFMTKPLFQSTDSSNQPYRITADKAEQQDDERVKMDVLQADISLEDGTWIAMMSDIGLYDPKKETMFLPNIVEIYHDSGYELRGEGIMLQLQDSLLYSKKPIAAHGPMGSITADGFIAYTDQQRAVFSPNVKVILHSK